MEPINWKAQLDEAVHHLQALLRLDTTNPPGNETLVAEYLAHVLRAEGIESVIVGTAPSRGNLVARLKGRGRGRPLLLMGHTDVVPAEPEHWTHPPFGGEVVDGFVWGRGALDMKCMVALELMVMLTLKRRGVELARDVIFAATADEEVSGTGISYLVKEHPDLIAAEYALNEGGGQTEWIAGKPIYPIQVGERGVCWTKVRVQGKTGHASVPTEDNAVVKLARALAGMRPMPQHVTSTVRIFVEALGVALGGELGQEAAMLLDEEKGSQVARRLFTPGMVGEFYAMLHNTAVPTRLKAGYKTNVIPSEAQVTLDGRFLPGFDQESYLAELRAALPEEVALEVEEYAPALESPYDSPLYRLAKEKLEALHPGATAVPFLQVGATDAKYLEPLGVQVYGFAPVRFEPDEPSWGLVHAHDERIPVAGFGFGLRALYETVHDFARG